MQTLVSLVSRKMSLYERSGIWELIVSMRKRRFEPGTNPGILGG